jgi:molybdopterin/thiamine biosynthesis adenylyltransferase
MKRVVVVGAGGNIGSHLVPHLGRMPEVGSVLLIDRGVYEAKDIAGQAILPADVGRRKATVQARRLRRIAPHLEVQGLHADIERLPWGALRGDLVLAGLDSRRARQWVNEVARRLGVTWVDAGVEGAGLLARLDVYAPGDEAACLECAWDERDYRELEQAYPCSGAVDEPPPTEPPPAAAPAGEPPPAAAPAGEPPPTAAPASLGALAAALQAIEAAQLLAGGAGVASAGEAGRPASGPATLAGSRLLIDAAHHRHLVVRLPRRGDCRFGDHRPWTIEPLANRPRRISLDDVLALGAGLDDGGGLRLSVAASRFVRRLVCPACGENRTLLRLEVSLSAGRRRCGRCGAALRAAAFDRALTLTPASLPERLRRRSLHGLGFRDGEVFTLAGARGARHFEIRSGRRELDQEN